MGWTGFAWFTASAAANALRAFHCFTSHDAPASTKSVGREVSDIDRHLRLSCLGALASGLVWAALPLLCAGYTSPQTLFYLAVTCGITAGAVTYGTAFAAVPICFITLPLLSVAGCLFVAGGFDRTCLALTVVLYLAALVRGTLSSERGFSEASRSKNDARLAALSREEARARASALAREMEQRATHDALTGILNRSGFSIAVEAAISRGATAACLMLLDLDGFKSVNDIYGHKTGDRVLAAVARRILEVVPPSCVASRLGGDEFAIFVDAAATGGRTVTEVASDLIRHIGAPIDGFDVGRIGASVGLHMVEDDDLARMLSCADAALYAAKREGRNRYRVFDEALRRRLEVRRDVKRDLGRAIAERHVTVWLQPIHGHGGHALCSFEALVRWLHPEHGWISPPDILSSAATNGHAESLIGLVLDNVCDAVEVLRDGGRTDLRVAMNVSPQEFAQLAVDQIVLGRLRERNLPVSMLEIELTEETAADVILVRQRLHSMAEAGVVITLDDFGAGYSSLASIHQLGARRVKMDRSLVSGLSSDGAKRKLVEAVIGLGHSMDLEVVAEGVESGEDLAALRAVGCRFMQGYLLGRPMPPGDALRLAGVQEADAA